MPHIVADPTEVRGELNEIPGIVPGLAEFGQDRCLFASRCHMVQDHCLQERPPEKPFGAGHAAACWRAEEM